MGPQNMFIEKKEGVMIGWTFYKLIIAKYEG